MSKNLHKIAQEAINNFQKTNSAIYTEQDFTLVKEGMKLMCDVYSIYMENVLHEDEERIAQYQRKKRLSICKKTIKALNKTKNKIGLC